MHACFACPQDVLLLLDFKTRDIALKHYPGPATSRKASANAAFELVAR